MTHSERLEPFSPKRGAALREPKRNPALLLFIALSLGVSMIAITQEETPEVGSFSYWLLIGATVLLPIKDTSAIVSALFGRARSILLFGLVAGAWQIAHGDIRAAQQLLLIVWILGWLSTDRAHLDERDLIGIYLTLILIGLYIWIQTDINQWGVLPNTTTYELDWRVSFFPNIANSAILSLGIVLILTRNQPTIRQYALIIGVGVYFLVLSFVRTALIGIALYIFMRWWLNRRQRSSNASFWMALLLGVGINALIASSPLILNYLQQSDIISRLFLRSEAELTPEEIYAQLYRPWLWLQHMQIFWQSPALMGHGTFEFFELQIEELNVGTTPAGNESQPTRLLATYGLPGLLYTCYFIERLRQATRDRDNWAIACFPTFALLLMQWGSVFHPSDANGIIFTLIAIHGSNALVPTRPACSALKS